MQVGQLVVYRMRLEFWDEEVLIRVRRIHARGSATLGITYRFTRKYPRATCWLTGRPSYNQGTL